MVAIEFDNYAEKIYLNEVRDALNEYDELHSIVFSAMNSNAFAIHLICKHAGIYRKARGSYCYSVVSSTVRI